MKRLARGSQPLFFKVRVRASAQNTAVTIADGRETLARYWRHHHWIFEAETETCRREICSPIHVGYLRTDSLGSKLDSDSCNKTQAAGERITDSNCGTNSKLFRKRRFKAPNMTGDDSWVHVQPETSVSFHLSHPSCPSLSLLDWTVLFLLCQPNRCARDKEPHVKSTS